MKGKAVEYEVDYKSRYIIGFCILIFLLVQYVSVMRLTDKPVEVIPLADKINFQACITLLESDTVHHQTQYKACALVMQGIMESLQ